MLAVLCAAWPKYELPDETAALWASQLTRVLVVDALEAAAQIARTDEWFPSLARFVETVQICARRRAADAAHAGRQLQSDNSPVVNNVEGAAWVRRVRQTLQAAPKPPHVDGVQSIGETMTEQFT